MLWSDVEDIVNFFRSVPFFSTEVRVKYNLTALSEDDAHVIERGASLQKFDRECIRDVETQEVALDIAQRYVDSAFCTWRTTGGATSNLPKLESVEEGDDYGGAMFEKYNSTDITAFGGGGEYEVQLGFGWSNGVLIWIGDEFGADLQLPACEQQLEEGGDGGDATTKKKRSLTQEMPRKKDAKWRRNGH